jgi:hypothetical protein
MVMVKAPFSKEDGCRSMCSVRSCVAWRRVQAEDASFESGSSIILAPRGHCQIGNGSTVRCISTLQTHPRGSLCWGLGLCRRLSLRGSNGELSESSLQVFVLQHGVQVKAAMVIGPYDRRLKQSRCLSCIARHNKARSTWPADRNRLRSDNRIVLGRHALLVLSKSLTRL